MKVKTDFLPTEVRNEVDKLVERITTEFKDSLLKVNYPDLTDGAS